MRFGRGGAGGIHGDDRSRGLNPSGHVRKSLTPLLLATLPALAHAQPVTGFYVAAGSGLNVMQSQDFQADVAQSALTRATRAGPMTVPASNTTILSRNDFHPGAVTVASIGYGFGNGMRLELEADYRFNAESSGMVRPGVDMREQKFGGMGNALFDMDIGSPYVFPYFGGGVGVMRVDRAYGPSSVRQVGYQGIGGAAVPLPRVQGLSLTLEYRFLGLVDADGSGFRPATATVPAASATASYRNDMNHSLLVGLRYAFGGGR